MTRALDSAVICTKCGKHSGTLYYVPETGEIGVCKKCLPIVFARGEEVEVSDDESFINPHPGKYVCTINHEYKYLVEVNCGIPTGWKCIRKLPKQEGGPKVFTKEQICHAYTNARKGNVRSLDDILDGILSQLDMLEE